ncbi:MAG: DNA polymerase III subunit epsilon [Chloroflexi bacterium]|nr:DNA polymerase III subunit epsilon [Chloroflexota bacterium]
MNQTIVALDLETTGLRPESDEILEIGAVKFRGREILDTFSVLVKPRAALPLRIQRLTGIRPEEVQGAPPLAAVLPDFKEFLGSHTVVGHNVAFDLAFLAQRGVAPAGAAYDTAELASLLLPRQPSYSLAQLARSLASRATPRHRATPDAEATLEVFLALWERALGLPVATLSEAHRLAATAGGAVSAFFREALQERGRRALTTAAPDPRPEPPPAGPSLSPREEAVPLDLPRLTQVLGKDGPLAQALPTYEERPQQMRMMQEVARAFNEKESLLVEAGTGTGKSLAYLLPSLCYAWDNGRPVVVSTNTINLQEQLLHKDIPQLVGLLEGQGAAPRAVSLKGRSNYLCRRRWGALMRSESLSPAEARFLIKLLIWLGETASGERGDLNLRGGEAGLWALACSQAESCQGGACPHQQRGECYHHQAREAARRAHVIVVNHALLLSDLLTEGQALPPYQHLILDEAHHLEEVATQQLGFQLSQEGVADYCDRLGPGPGSLLAQATALAARLPPGARDGLYPHLSRIGEGLENGRRRAEDFFRLLAGFIASHSQGQGNYARNLRITGGTRAQPDWAYLEMAWENLGLALKALGDDSGRLAQALRDLAPQEGEDLALELSSLAQTGANWKEGGDAIILRPQDKKAIPWLTLESRGGVSLRSAPLEVGTALTDMLFSQKETVVLTGATLRAGDSFDYLKGRLGAEGFRELALDSPFDYRRAALIYLPQDLPEPTQAGYQHALEAALVEVVRAAQGRTLALFTSHAALQTTYAAVEGPLAAEGIAVLGQGLDGTPKQLLDALRENPRCLLLGAASFWEGVDVAGEALSALVMARLPFTVPTDPVFAARAELCEDPFRQYAVPQAVLRFKQGFGRLIRSRQDRGVFVVMDRRLLGKSYGSSFLGALPPCQVERGPARQLAARVREWLEKR